MAWGQLTAIIYGFIRDNKYSHAIKVLEEQLREFPDSHAALSLLGYCFYNIGHFHAAASMYKQLYKMYPKEDKYMLYHAQSLYKSNPEGWEDAQAGMLADAGRSCLAIDGYQKHTINLQACIQHELGDIAGCSMILEQSVDDNIDAAINLACCLFKEGNYVDALDYFTKAMNTMGFQPELAYNKAVCLYCMKLFDAALKTLVEIFEHGIKEHPELSVGSHIEGMELRSVGNSQTLKNSALIEAFNLKASIAYVSGNLEAAREALNDMPPRAEEEIDSITLHNQALMSMHKDPATGFRKLNFLLQNPPFPPETYGNLLLLYCKPSHELHNLATDLLSENADLASRLLSEDLRDFLDATICSQTSAEEAYHKFNELANRQGEALRCIMKQIQDARTSHDQDAFKKAVTQYEEALEVRIVLIADSYVPVLMSMAKLWWDKENYLQVERILHQSADLCSDHDTWKLNVAHTVFLQDNRYKEAIHYYDPVVKKAGDDVFSVAAIVLANLCVCYIMSGRNDQAEELMHKIEKEEEKAQYEDPEKQSLHLCIVNLVIGTLYCAKQNFEFGISRIIKCLEPYGRKIEMDTWLYAKRCFLALIEQLAKQMIVLKDSTYADIDDFLDAAEVHGKSITISEDTSANLPAGRSRSDSLSGTRTVSQEARLLKCMFLRIRE